MQITNSVVCDMRKGGIFKQTKQSLVVEHAFPLQDRVCLQEGSCYIWWQRWDNVNCLTGVALPM